MWGARSYKCLLDHELIEALVLEWCQYAAPFVSKCLSDAWHGCGLQPAKEALASTVGSASMWGSRLSAWYHQLTKNGCLSNEGHQHTHRLTLIQFKFVN